MAALSRGVMATNPHWRLPVEQWRQQFAEWSREPVPDAVLHSAIFHDMRHLVGDRRLAEQVHLAAVSMASPRLLGHLSRQALAMRVPLGFFRGLVLERHGDHRGHARHQAPDLRGRPSHASTPCGQGHPPCRRGVGWMSQRRPGCSNASRPPSSTTRSS